MATIIASVVIGLLLILAVIGGMALAMLFAFTRIDEEETNKTNDKDNGID